MVAQEKRPLRQLLIASGIALAAFCLLTFSLAWSAPLHPVNRPHDFAADQGTNNPALVLDGMESPLTLSPAGLTAPGIEASHWYITQTWLGFAILSRDGSTVLALGTIECHEPSPFSIIVSIQQRDRQAVGSTQGRCQETEQAWHASAEAVQNARFEAGAARACSLVLLRHEDGSITRDRTCRLVRLLAAPQ
jgi:hypothetical protein